jgi:hypothetical protein
VQATSTADYLASAPPAAVVGGVELSITNSGDDVSDGLPPPSYNSNSAAV